MRHTNNNKSRCAKTEKWTKVKNIKLFHVFHLAGKVFVSVVTSINSAALSFLKNW